MKRFQVFATFASAVVTLALLASCGDEDHGDPAAGPKFAAGDTAYCLVAGVDYTNNVGALAGIALPSLTVTKDLVPGATSGDPVLREAAGRIFIVNRVAANVTVIDRSTFAVVSQFSTGAGSNPQDIALAGNGDKAFVATLGTGSVQVWDVGSTHDQPETTIDISSYDTDGVPDANSIAIVGTRAYVSLELLDENFVPQGNGTIVAIDTALDTVVDDFSLTSENPTNLLVPGPTGALLVGTSGDYSGTTGCVESITTGTSPASGGCVVTNAALGGIPGGLATSGTTTYVSVSAPDFMSAKLVSVTGGVVSASLLPDSEIPGTLAIAPTGVIVYADSAAGGVRVYDPAAKREVTTDAIDVGLPPAFANGIVCVSR